MISRLKKSRGPIIESNKVCSLWGNFTLTNLPKSFLSTKKLTVIHCQSISLKNSPQKITRSLSQSKNFSQTTFSQNLRKAISPTPKKLTRIPIARILQHQHATPWNRFVGKPHNTDQSSIWQRSRSCLRIFCW